MTSGPRHPRLPDYLSLTLAALADPTRRAILAHLAGTTAQVPAGDLAGPLGVSLPVVSKHLKVLERAGLVSRQRRAQWRYCRLEPAPLRDLAGWLESYRGCWDDSLQRLHDYLDHLPPQPAKDTHA